MKDTTLVIMAAGMGSRFGGIKQLEAVGPAGEIIMDYSIFDAKEAGFTKIVFVIRKDIEEEFKKIIGNRISKYIKTDYVIQDIANLPEGFSVPEGRTKPWGTGQAVLACLGKVNEPFAVINADDYYGKEAFVKINQFLQGVNEESSDGKYHFCMPGFILKNTLSDNGTVTRGICKVEDGKLVDIVETSNIAKTQDGACIREDGKETVIDENSYASMNFWGFTKDFLDELNVRFADFLSGIEGNELKAEYLLPSIVGDLLTEDRADVTVLDTQDKWFGVTYKEDKPVVVESFRRLVEEGVYEAGFFK